LRSPNAGWTSTADGRIALVPAVDTVFELRCVDTYRLRTARTASEFSRMLRLERPSPLFLPNRTAPRRRTV